MGGKAGLRHARKHLSAYVAGENAAEGLRRELVTTEEPGQAFRLLSSAFDPQDKRAA